MNAPTSEPFHAWLRRHIAEGPLPADRVVRALVPLFRQVAACHERGLVAPLTGLRSLAVSDDTVYFAGVDAVSPRQWPEAIRNVEGRSGGGVEITAQGVFDETGPRPSYRRRLVLPAGETPKTAGYLHGYLAWEHALDHHDPLTDVFSLGLLLASLALGLDLAEDDDLQQFVDAQDNPFALHPTLHPVLGRCIVRMTEVRRPRRAQDLPGLAALLLNHRDQEAQAAPLDLGAGDQPRIRRHRIQERLRDRLFDCSRRNRLLYYKPSNGHLNLTLASVPLQLPVADIRPDDLCTWQGGFADDLTAGRSVNLGKWLRFEEAPYVPAVLDRIRLDERRDRQDYGSSQLRLVVAFLRWHDLKAGSAAEKAERISSPLLLLPVRIDKRKGVRDAWTLTADGSEAEINPVLRHQLRQRFGLDLPETVDLAEVSIAELHVRLRNAIQAGEPGVNLELIDRPRIDLIQQRARARVAQHRRRARLTGRGVRRNADIEYSYEREAYAPYALQLFTTRLRATPFPQALVAGASTRVRPLPMNGSSSSDGSVERSVDTFVLRDQDGGPTQGNPYAWEFDRCALVLGNFNYRKMTLVRDYRAMLEHDQPSATVDAVFANAPRPVEPPIAADPLTVWSVVLSDPTQSAAVARAHQGTSYVIQGPPGTGKSQVITNLIADQVARGQRVLFVCAKRAALDVVYHRLATRGLDRLCCLIHDSQQDKKAFIQALKLQYEDWLANDPLLAERRAERERCLAGLRSALAPLDRFTAAMLAADPADGATLRTLLGRLVELAEHATDALSAVELEALPGYAAWTSHGAAVTALGDALAALSRPPIFAHSALRQVRRELLADERPLNIIGDAITRSEQSLATASEGALAFLDEVRLGDWTILAEDAARLLVLAERDLLRLLDPVDAAHGELRAAVAKRRELAAVAEAATARTVHWREPLPDGDCAAVLAQAQAQEHSVLRFLSPSWYRLRRILRERYRFDAHVVAPSWSVIIRDLMASYAAQAELASCDRALAATWQVESLQVLLAALQGLGEISGDVTTASDRRRLRDEMRAGTMTAASVRQLAERLPALLALRTANDALSAMWSAQTASAWRASLASMRVQLSSLPRLATALRELTRAPEALWRVLCERPWTASQVEHALLQAALAAAHRRDPTLPRLDAEVLGNAAADLRRHQRALLDANAALIIAETHARFRERALRAVAPGLTGEEREQGKRYARGRRELEKEFAKVMRHRSIRDLADDETGLVVADLKPVWLMSPLSVSDTLPLIGADFDVVVFDEASQIPLEEAVPALHRAPQAIVVGDQQQLPPTTFFATAGDDEEVEVEAASERVDLDHDSFLTQAAVNLPGTMLGWHYRSRSESLIAFSNAAFYEGRLLTIPDAVPAAARGTIDPAGDDAALVAQVISRPVAFVHLPGSPYLQRTNPGEAAVVARLVRGLLRDAPHLSIGVVAFSEAQQEAISRAITVLCEEDAEFRERFDAAGVREDDGQFCGLFVKNLENVQGDERDLIILSVCYGPDAAGRMVMNFGPINQNGGEKRLNVVFSRARRHMVVVSSITSDAITNDYNTGANTLKSYLAFAQAASTGEGDRAARVLVTLTHGVSDLGRAEDAVATALAARLVERGWQIARDVGSSRLRIDVAVRRPGEAGFRVGILIDHEADYRALTPWERDLSRPATLDAFGWRIVRVWAADWVRDQQAVIARIEGVGVPNA